MIWNHRTGIIIISVVIIKEQQQQSQQVSGWGTENYFLFPKRWPCKQILLCMFRKVCLAVQAGRIQRDGIMTMMLVTRTIRTDDLPMRATRFQQIVA